MTIAQRTRSAQPATWRGISLHRVENKGPRGAVHTTFAVACASAGAHHTGFTDASGRPPSSRAPARAP